MKDALELVRIHARRYWLLLIASVILMAIMGAMTAARTLLLKPVMGRVLRPAADAMPVPIFTIPIINYPIFLERPSSRPPSTTSSPWWRLPSSPSS